MTDEFDGKSDVGHFSKGIIPFMKKYMPEMEHKRMINERDSMRKLDENIEKYISAYWEQRKARKSFEDQKDVLRSKMDEDVSDAERLDFENEYIVLAEKSNAILEKFNSYSKKVLGFKDEEIKSTITEADRNEYISMGWENEMFDELLEYQKCLND